MTTWLTADLHLGHVLVSGLRGFDSVSAHDAAIIGNWCACVAAEDTVWVLGDVAMGGWRHGIPLMARLPGRKHLILGNHDRAHPMNNDGYAYMDDYREAFELVAIAERLRTPEVTFVLSHFPYDGDHTEQERGGQWRLRDEGIPLLHGHTHAARRQSRSRRGTLQVHVGLDAWGLQPVALAEVVAVALAAGAQAG